MTGSEKHSPKLFDIYPESIKVPICNQCIHRIPGTATCKAFPERIPQAILGATNDHRRPFPGDNGILFQPK